MYTSVDRVFTSRYKVENKNFNLDIAIFASCIRLESGKNDKQDVYDVADDVDDENGNDLMIKSSGMRYYDSMINALDIWL